MVPDPSPTRRRPNLGRRAAMALLLTAATVAATPHAARADEDEDVHYDARVQGYTPTVEAKSSSVFLTWILAILLGGGCLGVMFMNPKRSHLD